MLKINNSLQELNISGFFLFYFFIKSCKDNDFNNISEFAEALKYNKSLTSLTIEEGKLFLFSIFFLIN
jgi:hypothetical protein